jgi:hypothetical protein
MSPPNGGVDWADRFNSRQRRSRVAQIRNTIAVLLDIAI